MTALLRLAALALCAGAAACSNERVVADQPMAAYTRAEVAYAASNRDMRVVIQGNPFGMDAQSFGQLVTDNMQNRVSGVDTHFTTTPNDTARPDYRVVFAFNPAQTMLNSYLCAGQPIRTSPPGGPIVVQGAFCRGGGPLSSATGWLDSPRGPADPDFRQLISDMTFTLFPSAQSDAGCSGPDC
ncbi:hypothetical protein [Azospirillum canadense]|uniref:hypothetical protein n=1 Tax=Azospirillum canadense TaxID=403962 RepID=UPI0022278144|nr:hypothetical protein [Azospirillum canadense]MCW2243335.1 hypothetical protein [Azospirillum canadense]